MNICVYIYVHICLRTHICMCVIYIHIYIRICTLHSSSFYFHTDIQELGKQSVDTHTDTHRRTQTHTLTQQEEISNMHVYTCEHLLYVDMCVCKCERETHTKRERKFMERKKLQIQIIQMGDCTLLSVACRVCIWFRMRNTKKG